MKRHALTDEQWELVKPLIPTKDARTGRPVRDPRLMLDAAFWVLATGAPWRDLPERFGPHSTAHRYFSEWRKAGVFDRIVDALQVKFDDKGYIDWQLWCVDGASVRATRSAAGADKKVSTGTPTNPKTTHWFAASEASPPSEAGLDRSSTLSLTVRELRSPSRSPRDRSTIRRGRSRSSGKPSRD
jgi:transposase